MSWSLDRPGLSSGFVPGKIAEELDFVSVHLYPKRGAVPQEIDVLRGFAVGKPVLIEETFPLECSINEFRASSINPAQLPPDGWASIGARRPRSAGGRAQFPMA